MGAAFGWGALASSSLVLGGLITLRVEVGLRLLGLIMAFGAGVLISAVAFELVGEAATKTIGDGTIALGLLTGCAVFFVDDVLIDRMGGADRKDSGGDQAEGSPLAITLGIVLDGIPESIVLGLTILEGGSVSPPFSSPFCSRTSPSRSRPRPASRRRAGQRSGSSGSGCS